MKEKNTTFKFVKKGYDPRLVDNEIANLKNEIAYLNRKVSMYTEKLKDTMFLIDEMKERSIKLETRLENQHLMSEELSRVALQEANRIIKSAYESADMIVRESLQMARLLLSDIAKLAGNTDLLKKDMKKQLEVIATSIDNLKMPTLPDLRWLQEAEEKLQEKTRQ